MASQSFHLVMLQTGTSCINLIETDRAWERKLMPVTATDNVHWVVVCFPICTRASSAMPFQDGISVNIHASHASLQDWQLPAAGMLS